MLPGEAKTKEQLINELAELRQRVAELETSETMHKRAAEELQLLSSIAQQVSDSIIVTDTNYEITYINKATEDLFGYNREELEGRTPDILNAEPSAECIQEEMRQNLSSGGVCVGSLLNRRKDGGTFVCEYKVSPFRDKEGRTSAYIGVQRDITGRKQAEQMLSHERDLIQTLFENHPDFIYFKDSEARFYRISKRFCDFFGLSEEDIIGKTDLELFPEEVAKQTYSDDLHVIKTGIPLINREESAGEVWVLTTKIPWFDKEGNIIGLFGISRDITERKQAEEELRESEERYRSLMNLGGSVGEAIVMLQDRDGVEAVQIFVSNEWPRITGYSRKELLGMSFFDLLHPKYRQASLKRHQRRMSGEIIPGLFEMSIIRKDGTEVPIEITSAYTTYQGERANVAFIRDITERKQAEEREKELQRELNLSSRLASIGELAAGVAHEINNPLTGIMGFAQRLLRKSTDEEVSRDLERIHSEAQRVARVVENLRVFARRSEPKKEYSDINEILDRALELRAYELKTSNIEVATDLAPDIPRAMVDFQQVQQVFLNIVLNAEQAMTEANDGGKLTIKTQKAKGYIRVSFTDDGPGIPAEQFDRVFDPFFTTREERGGSGLGLSLCHGIVTEHGGRVYVRSKPGKGATFFVELTLTSDRQMRLDEANIGLNHKQAVAPD